MCEAGNMISFEVWQKCYKAPVRCRASHSECDIPCRMRVCERPHAGTRACCCLVATFPSIRVAQEAAQSHHLRVRD